MRLKLIQNTVLITLLDTKIAEIAQDEYEHSKELRKAMLMIA